MANWCNWTIQGLGSKEDALALGRFIAQGEETECDRHILNTQQLFPLDDIHPKWAEYHSGRTFGQVGDKWAVNLSAESTWDPPLEFLQRLSLKFPDCAFKMWYSTYDYDNSGGVYDCKNGGLGERERWTEYYDLGDDDSWRTVCWIRDGLSVQEDLGDPVLDAEAIGALESMGLWVPEFDRLATGEDPRYLANQGECFRQQAIKDGTYTADTFFPVRYSAGESNNGVLADGELQTGGRPRATSDASASTEVIRMPAVTETDNPIALVNIIRSAIPGCETGMYHASVIVVGRDRNVVAHECVCEDAATKRSGESAEAAFRRVCVEKAAEAGASRVYVFFANAALAWSVDIGLDATGNALVRNRRNYTSGWGDRKTHYEVVMAMGSLVGSLDNDDAAALQPLQLLLAKND